MEHLIDYMLNRMREEGNKFYNPSYATHWASKEPESATQVDIVPKVKAGLPNLPDPKPKAKTKAVPKPKAGAVGGSLADLLNQLDDPPEQAEVDS